MPISLIVTVSEEVLFNELCSGYYDYRANHLHIDVNTPVQLPRDGSFLHLTSICVESLQSTATESPADNTSVAGGPSTSMSVSESPDCPATTDETGENSDPYDAHLPQSFVPIATRSMTG